MRRTLVLGAVLWATASGCIAASSVPESRKHSYKPVELKGFGGVEDALGRLVRFQGRAQNDRVGALVISDDLSVWCQGMDAWPQRVVGRKVTVSGVLDRARAADGAGGSGDAADAKEGVLVGDFVLKHPKLE
ncbi:MAG: hypothetical protein QM765_36645 [Myxococcales bacterium]